MIISTTTESQSGACGDSLSRAASAREQEPEYGPPKGTLVIQGGGSDVGTGIFETFINKAGGLGAKIVVVPTAGGNKNRRRKIKVYKEEQVIAAWKRRGVTNVHMLHTADPKVADTEEFATILRDANGVWFDGGRQWNFVDSYANTLTLQGISQGAGARRRDRRQLGGRDDPGRLSGARSDRWFRDRDDAGTRA